MNNENTYNGWWNYQTWNVALYIQNEFSFYRIAQRSKSYADWLYFSTGVRKGATPDGVMWTDPRIDRAEIDSMIGEL